MNKIVILNANFVLSGNFEYCFKIKNDQKTLQSLALPEDTWLYLQHLDSIYIFDPSFEEDNFELTTYSSASQNQESVDNTWLYAQHLDFQYIVDPLSDFDGFELTTYSSTNQNQGNVINETTSGGSLASGIASQNITRNNTSTGGILAGSVGLVTGVCNIVFVGGSLAGGVASQTFSDVVEVGGGLLAGSVASQNVTYNFTPNVSLIFGGLTPANIVFNLNLFPVESFEDLLLLYRILNLVYVYDPSNLYEIYPRTIIASFGGIVLEGNSTPQVVVSFSGGSLAGGLASQTITYNNTSTGGSLAGGVGTISTIYNTITTGGSLAGGLASQTITYNNISTGGSLAGGVALQTFSDVVEVGGGSLAGGLVSQTITYNNISTGGSLAGGVALQTITYNNISTGGSLAGGVALQTFSDVVEVGGGSLAGGVALQTITYNNTSTGGSLAGGVALQTITYNNTSTGGSLAGGVALQTITYNNTSTGGSLAGGVGTISTIYNTITTGGSLAGGLASQTITYNNISTGGLLAGGVALQTFSDVVEVGGGSLAGGLASQTITYNNTPTGGSLAGGVALQSFSYIVEVSGGSLAGGVALQSFSYIVEVSGGSLAGGISQINCLFNHNFVFIDPLIESWALNHLGLIYFYDIVNHDDEYEISTYASPYFELGYSGSVLIGGIVEASVSFIGSGGVVSSGSSTINFNDVVEVEGGIVCGGISFVGKSFVEVISGGLLLGGESNSNFAFNITQSGGIQLTGSAVLYFNNASEVEGGIVCGGISFVGKSFVEVISGGLLLGGESKPTLNDVVDVGGGVFISGFALRIVENVELSGGLKAGGSVQQTTVDVGGGVSLGGISDVLATYNPDPTYLSSDDLLLYQLLNLTYVYNPTNLYDRYPQGFVGGIFLGGKSQSSEVDLVQLDSSGLVCGGESFVFCSLLENFKGGLIVSGDIFKGSALISGSASVNLITKTKNLRFGKTTFGEVVYLNADFQSIFLWNRSLTDAEIENVYLNSHKVRENFEDGYFPLFFDQNFEVETQGGIQLGGSALLSQTIETKGGFKVGGESKIDPILGFISSGGLSIPPTSADVNKQNNISSTGGVKTSGLADLTDLSSGGLVCSGSVVLRVIANIFPTGFVKASGSSSALCTFNIVGKNGIIANGKAINLATYDLKVSGGVTVSGNSAFGISKDITPRINLLSSGSADLRTIFGPRATSGSLCSGSVSVDAQYNLDLTPSGLRLGGTSRIFVARDELFNGGCLSSGSINLLKETSLISKVSINLGGLSAIACNYKIDSLSSCIIGGFGFVYANYSITSKQSIIASGSGVSFVRNNIFSQIKLICGGLASDEMDKIYFMEGGLRSSGSAETLVYYDIRPLGGILNSGRSNVSLIVSKTSSVEVFVSGLSLNIFINSTSGGIVLSGFSTLVDQRVYNYIVSTKRQNRLLLGSNSEFDENNYYYEQSVGGCKVGGSFVVTFASGASGVTLGGTSQPVANRLYNYIVSTKRQNRLLLGSNSEFDENNYYYEQTEGGCEASGKSIVTFASGASGVTLGGTSQPVANRLCSYIVSTKRQNRLLLGSNSEFDENNYYYEQTEGGVAIGINFVVVQISGASGVTLGGTSQPVANRLYSYIVSTKRQNRLLLGSNSEFDENNYYYEQSAGECKVGGSFVVTYVSGASGVTLSGTSQPVANRFFVFKSQGQIAISGLVSGKRNSYRNEFLGQFKLSGLADCQLVCRKLACDEGGLKCKTKTPCESIVCDYSKEYFANCKYNKQNIRRCKTTSALLPAISNCRQKGYLPIRNRTRKAKERVTL